MINVDFLIFINLIYRSGLFALISRLGQTMNKIVKAKVNSRRTEPIKKSAKYFQIVDTSLPELPGTSNRKRNQNPYELTKSLVKNKKFVYIDLMEDSGIKAMDPIDPQDSDQQTERYGNSFVSNLTKLSKESQKLNIYLTKVKKMTDKKDHLRSLVKSQLQRSGKRIRQMSDNDRGHKQIRIYRGMDTIKLRKYMDDRELQQINADIDRKQRKLVFKFGIVADAKSFSEKNNDMQINLKNRNLPRLENKSWKTVDHSH